MSLPEFPKPENILSQEQAINAIITSVAMVESALSHIINAESEKIKYAIDCFKCNCSCEHLQKLLEINKSASALIEQVNDIELILKNKLRLATNCMPCKPKPPEKPDCPDDDKNCCCICNPINCGTPCPQHFCHTPPQCGEHKDCHCCYDCHKPGSHPQFCCHHQCDRPCGCDCCGHIPKPEAICKPDCAESPCPPSSDKPPVCPAQGQCKPNCCEHKSPSEST